jgi:nucleotide-binding universal stress UspA family protein
MGAGWPVGLPEELRKETQQALDRAADIASGTEPMLPIETATIEGEPAYELLTESASAALLVVGSRHRQTMGSVLLGSVGAGVAPRAQCPVVVVRGPAGELAVGAWTVAGMDGGPGDQEVLAYAFDHAGRHGTGLKAVLCWHPHAVQPAHWLHELYAQARQDAEERLGHALAGWPEKYPDVRVSQAVVDEHPGAGLVAEGHGAHLLVVGTHGHHALAGTLLGSTSQAVLHHATCPVAVIHTGRKLA